MVGRLLLSERKREIRDRVARTRRLYTDVVLGNDESDKQDVDSSSDASGDIKPKNTCGSSTGGRPRPGGSFDTLETFNRSK